ncbi:MAG: type VI secretion system contractile sheath small subunit [Spirochaetaceae bacterium]|jgi:type VI secretion system protein ImpB|nr:type VI secretion system contractile sheath small subunit [Spirochaetaceae bacterium]
MAESSQKFIAKNRAPRVQIEYDVEQNGAEKKVELPFVMGVMSDLSGKPEEPLPRVDDRQMLEFNSENFDDRIKAIKPRVAFSVPNVLSGEGNIPIDMTFESMGDFLPGAVTSKVDGLKQLMEAREQLANLLSYMDGKQGAEDLLNKILKDPALLKALSQKAKEAGGPEAGAAEAAAPKTDEGAPKTDGGGAEGDAK